MIHYHGTPITPKRVLLGLGGKHFCVSYADARDVLSCHQIGQSVMLDNGAYTAWTIGKKVDWAFYYEWCEKWLVYRTTWAIIPDVIDGTEDENDRLVARSPLSFSQSVPVWHLHEPLHRILRLMDLGYERICFGSSGEYATIGTDRWHHRVSEAFNLLSSSGPIPWIHMLRGMSLSGSHYPFSSVDSSDVARHHGQPSYHNKSALAMANRWDALQCPATWNKQALQEDLL